MNVVPYRKEHLEDLIDGDLSQGTDKHIFARRYAQSLELPDWSFTVLDHGHLVACVGITEMWAGVGEAWFVGSARIHEKSKAFIRLTRSGIFEDTIKRHGLWRVQAACRANWPEALRFAKFMGFKEEGLMKKYGQNGEDFIRVAKFND